jgi:tripartite-type tricarboxylate transporter receptor subunit TctC
VEENVMGAITRWAAIVCALLAGIAAAHAQNYPERPIHLIVAFVPGGATDTMARQIQQDLSEALGQTVVVENRPGASGYLAWNYVAGAAPDGYTLLLCENALAISQGLFKKAASTFDPVKQYDAVAHVATSPLALVVADKVPANSVRELIALSHTVPQKMNYASAGVGSVAHLTFEVFRDAAGIDAIHIPYKGGGQAMGDIIAGQVEMHMASIQVAAPLALAGRIKALAVTSKHRSPALPDVPTLIESGLKLADLDLNFWYGIFGPKGMPDAVRAKLDKAVQTVMNSPRVRERLAKLDIEPAYMPADALETKLQNEIVNWTKFIDEKGIKAE